LPIYFRDQGLGVAEIVTILLFTFIVLGFLPVTFLKLVKNFEKVISVGIFMTMLFYVALIFVKNPLILGLAQGVSLATFWPSFNLLQFRLSGAKARARTISLYSSIIPSIAGIFGPATGGFIIQSFGFTSVFAVSITLYMITFLLSLKIPCKPETYKFSIPKNNMFAIFFTTFVVAGLSETNWLAYPFFLYSVSGTVLNMGLVLAVTGILISAITFSINWLSDIKKTRIEFAVIGTVLSAAWYFGVGFATSTSQIIVLSLLSGFANAFRISWFAHYGDSFANEQYASILVMMETALMVGRIVNLTPTYIFMSQADYTSYFILLGTILLSLIPLYLISKNNSLNNL
jgi:MFS family permease